MGAKRLAELCRDGAGTMGYVHAGAEVRAFARGVFQRARGCGGHRDAAPAVWLAASLHIPHMALFKDEKDRRDPRIVTEFAVAVEDLRKTYGSGPRAVNALSGVTIRVAQGEIYGLLGRNGAGKTTLVKSLLDIVR